VPRRTRNTSRNCASTAEQHLRRGAPIELLDGDAAARATGTDRYAGAMLDRRGGALNPLSYTRGLARAASAPAR
jgi:glycine/D-amino acid oxidase-like deaminating enzyme